MWRLLSKKPVTAQHSILSSISIIGVLSGLLCFCSSVYADTPGPRANLAGLTIDEMILSWVPIKTSSGQLDPGPNLLFGMTALPQENTIVIDGGSGLDGANPTVHDTVAFDVDSMTWRLVGHSIVADSQNRVYVATGYSDVDTGSNVTVFPRQMSVLDFPTGAWTTNTASLPDDFLPRSAATGVLGNDGIIYYIGGFVTISRTSDAGPVTSILANMTDILTYDTSTSLWIEKQTNLSQLTPSPRYQHTSTLNPKTGEIIVYGGFNGSMFGHDDYFYVLDIETMSWKTETLNRSANASGAGPIYGHQAIIDADALILLFGHDREGLVSNNIHVLDLNTYSWIDHIVGAEPDGVSADDDPESNNDGLASGAIAGIAVGIVAVICIVGVILYIYIRRRRQKQKSTSVGTAFSSDGADEKLKDDQFDSSNDAFEVTEHRQQQQQHGGPLPPASFLSNKPSAILLEDLAGSQGSKIHVEVVSNHSIPSASDVNGNNFKTQKTSPMRPDGAVQFQSVKPDKSEE
ncbi:hypothetical protein BDB00DRAFT_929708 [Zychaea mexicana]|uniref:uncharacterized protein n=1 Tax=Zychaea mexicana TaxID=64656 RepID=UPI0022FF3BDF|nr:uncharacterized protein BDB00DRAFT_929708 [Zychaea mexicana]KAI9492487.1 hypothetical protein BDB00DRAFT_929708 [Zychaea mexicana]